MMDYEKVLREQFDECEKSGYFFFIPVRSLYPLLGLILKDDDIILLEPTNLKKDYFELIEKSARSPAEDDDAVTDRPGMK